MRREQYFLDTEFIEDGRTIELISIGVVNGDRELHLCNAECDLSRAGDWVQEHVLPQLPERSSSVWVSREEIAARLLAFVLPDPKPEFWAYYGDYDWVVLCQLFGRMEDLPEHFPKFCMDLKQLAVMRGSPVLPKQAAGEHDALQDARWNQEIYEYLMLISPSLAHRLRQQRMRASK